MMLFKMIVATIALLKKRKHYAIFVVIAVAAGAVIDRFDFHVYTLSDKAKFNSKEYYN